MRYDDGRRSSDITRRPGPGHRMYHPQGTGVDHSEADSSLVGISGHRLLTAERTWVFVADGSPCALQRLDPADTFVFYAGRYSKVLSGLHSSANPRGRLGPLST
jgi:hypothetical protein